MDPSESSSPKPLALLPGFSRRGVANITIYCHDPLFKAVDILDDASGETLFTVESKGASSLSWRRTVLTPDGTKLFDLRHFGYAMKNDWAVEDPTGKRICSLKHVSGKAARNRSNLDAVVHGESTADDVGNTVEIRPKDRGALSTAVLYQGHELATILNTEANDVQSPEKKGLDRTVWKARINAGVDISLILVAVLCLAEMEHVWRQ
ncbi:hypothetical protein E4T44_07408 [Aureobasidium sp. EXF-8845]|nr:hypothetical protein E4T44_07408 [Aureobasidium sp. EXF-8845]KAI4848740.1 hypothetical protein E4T45_06205 [Aureobasidium sp. EXF-8846]